MKGIIKGSLFSVLLIIIFISIISVVQMNIDIPDTIIKISLWILMGISVFAGCLPVARSGENKKILRGIGCGLITVVALFISVCIAAKHIPTTGTFYTLALICLVCGLLGAAAGATK